MLTAEKSYNFLPRRQRHKATAKNKNAKSVTQKVDSVKELQKRRRETLGGGEEWVLSWRKDAQES